MSKLKLSPWHDVNMKPMHVGIYETDVNHSTSFSFWDGENWWYSAPCLEYVLSPTGGYVGFISSMQNRKWRGVLK